jgi:hypothetical protein
VRCRPFGMEPRNNKEKAMKKSNVGIKVNAGVKAGGIVRQHNRKLGIRVNAGVKAGGLKLQHNRAVRHG